MKVDGLYTLRSRVYFFHELIQEGSTEEFSGDHTITHSNEQSENSQDIQWLSADGTQLWNG